MPNDPNGRVATLVLPIKVTPRENQPPVFGGGVIDFEPGETKVLDLLKLTTYPYPKDLNELTYSMVGQPPAGFSYTLSAQKLTLRANNDAAKNTTSTIVLGVRDDIAEGKSGSIQLGVVPSTRPLARPAADVAVTPARRRRPSWMSSPTTTPPIRSPGRPQGGRRFGGSAVIPCQRG